MALMVLGLIFSLAAGPVMAQDEKKEDKPDRGLVASLRYPGLTLGPEEKIRIDLIVKNTGRSNETILLAILEKPEGWVARIKDFGTVVDGIFLAEDDDRTLTLTAKPEGETDKLPEGEFRFVVEAQTADGALSETSSVTVKVEPGKKTDEEIELTTSYPVLRGPSDGRFEFSLDVNNDSEEDALFNLMATAPEGWDVSFKPAYEQKQISSLQIKANQSKSVSVEVTPPPRAEAGEYPINVRVASSKAKAEVILTVVLTGTYKMKIGTLDGLLSMSAQKGKPVSVSFYVQNDGSAVQREISFVSFKPEDWKVEFKPEKVEGLKGGDIKQVEMTVTPSDEALVGDYSVAVSAQGEKSNDEIEFRVTVKASSAWGWIGVGIIVLVILGLAVTFRRLGRR
jgi:uncharacterized membrane protein